MIDRAARWALVCLLGMTLMSCKKQQVIERPVAPPAAAFTGPAYLSGTVGSMTTRWGYAPIFVSGYGLVVNLPGTGSPDVPGFLRQEMLTRLRREGFGSRRAGLADMTPESILASEDTAVVAVEGFIPAGAVTGTRFDVLVSALPQTGTTSLEGGFLRTLDMSLLGTNEQLLTSRTLAKARGSMYLHPFDAKSTAQSLLEQNTQAVVIGGGVVTEPSRLELRLNQPSWSRSSQIAERIKEVFPKGPGDRDDTAVAKTDLVIQINVPARYAHNVGRFLDLLEHVYTQRGPTFEMEQAHRLGEIVTLAPREARRVAIAWEALGKRALGVIRTYYDHENLTVRMAALQAGVRLDDQLAADPLLELSKWDDVQVRLHVAEVLEDLHDSMRGARVLITMLDDVDDRVRIAAYESLAAQKHPVIQRTDFFWDKQPKFTLDLVPSQRPLVHISMKDGPRIVIFNGMTPLKPSTLTRLWDNQLMIRTEGENDAATIFFQHHGQVDPEIQIIAPTAANLVFLLGQQKLEDNDTPGFNLPFGRVVNVLYQMCRDGQIPARLDIQETPLAVQIAQARAIHQQQTAGRPWSQDQPGPSDATSPDGTPASDAAPGDDAQPSGNQGVVPGAGANPGGRPWTSGQD